MTLTEDGWWSMVAAGWGGFGEAARNGRQSWISGHTKGEGENLKIIHLVLVYFKWIYPLIFLPARF